MSTSASRPLAAAAVLTAVLAAGCNLAPRYHRPAVEAAPVYKELSPDGTLWQAARPADGEARGKWWEALADPRLNELEDQAGVSNQSVVAAAAAFLAARAAVKQARAQYYPAAAASAGATRARVSATPIGLAANHSFTEYSLSFDASWQPDFWGKARNAVAAGVFAAQAGAADLENVRLTVQAELAVDYYELRAQDELISLLEAAARAYEETVSLNQVLSAAGLVSDQVVAQAQAQLGAARAQAVNAGLLRAQYEHAIATLLGRPASSFALPPEPFRPPNPALPVGVPSELLQRRPDIASAERAVAQANALIGVARAAYFPSLTLSASAGLESFSAADWMSLPSRFWSLGANAAQTVFEAGAKRAAVRQYRALHEQASANYRQTVLMAFQQVEDALASVRISSADAQRQDEAVAAGARDLTEAAARYQAGLTSYLDVLATEVSLISLQQTALAFRLQQVAAAVRLVEALGGGWNEAKLPGPRELR
ncbi:MAG: efflux transporter outer membrane subunit [Elusimicrobia bacterium]|nr:efflux transporter outer membrane subunit [Elusimicrobiota bacterium]